MGVGRHRWQVVQAEQVAAGCYSTPWRRVGLPSESEEARVSQQRLGSIGCMQIGVRCRQSEPARRRAHLQLPRSVHCTPPAWPSEASTPQGWSGSVHPVALWPCGRARPEATLPGLQEAPPEVPGATAWSGWPAPWPGWPTSPWPWPRPGRRGWGAEWRRSRGGGRCVQLMPAHRHLSPAL